VYFISSVLYFSYGIVLQLFKDPEGRVLRLEMITQYLTNVVSKFRSVYRDIFNVVHLSFLFLLIPLKYGTFGDSAGERSSLIGIVYLSQPG